MTGPRATNGRFVRGQHAYRDPKPHWNAEWLREQYEARQQSASVIATACGVKESAVLFWLKKHGIARRTTAQARAVKHWGVQGAANPMFGKTGALNPRYVDGSSPERQRLYASGEGRQFIREVLARDGYRCRRCKSPKVGRGSLHVHHLKPWAGNEALRFDKNNAVTVCRYCHEWIHSKANERREWLQ